MPRDERSICKRCSTPIQRPEFVCLLWHTAGSFSVFSIDQQCTLQLPKKSCATPRRAHSTTGREQPGMRRVDGSG